MTRLKIKTATNEEYELQEGARREIQEKIDKVLMLKKQEADIAAELEIRLRDRRREIGALSLEIENYLKEAKLTTLPSLTGMGVAEIKIKAGTSREIDAKAFYDMLQKTKKINLFWQYATVGVTKSCKDFGEKILQAAKVLTIKTTESEKFDIHES